MSIAVYSSMFVYGFDILYTDFIKWCVLTSITLTFTRLITYKITTIDTTENKPVYEISYISFLISYTFFHVFINIQVLREADWSIWRQSHRVDANIPEIEILRDQLTYRKRLYSLIVCFTLGYYTTDLVVTIRAMSLFYSRNSEPTLWSLLLIKRCNQTVYVCFILLI